MTTIDKDAPQAEVRRGAGQAAAARRQRPVPRSSKDQLAHYLDDPYTPVVEREPKTDHVTVAFIGGGFAGLVTGARLKEAGIDDVRIIEKGGDFGGTWYWNRYPGAQCDTACVRLHAAARRDRPHADREVRARARDPRALPAHREAVRPLRQRAVPHRGHRPRVGRRRGRAGSSAPTGATSSPPSSSAMGTGPLHVPKLPGIPGIETFQGHSFHTSRWDYDYTGGDPSGAPMDSLADKRVAHHRHRRHRRCSASRTSAAACGELYVFQRTPSSVDVRDNQPDRSRVVRRDRHAGLAAALARELHRQPDRRCCADEDLVMDGWTDLARRIREQDHGAAARGVHAREDDGGLRGLRLREDGGDPRPGRLDRRGPGRRRRSSRPGTASCASGRASTTSTCRRSTSPAPTSSTPTARASSASPRPASWSPASSTRSTASSTRRASRSAPTYTRRAGYDMTGRDGVQAVGVLGRRACAPSTASTCTASRTLFIVQPTQGANLISNVPAQPHRGGQDDRHDRPARARQRPRRGRGHRRRPRTRGSSCCSSGPALSVIGSPDCTPGYYNNEGQPGGAGRELVPRLPRRRHGLLPVHRRVAHARATSKASTSASSVLWVISPGLWREITHRTPFGDLRRGDLSPWSWRRRWSRG